MNSSRLGRWSYLTGALAVVLFVSGGLVDGASPQQVGFSPNRMLIGVYISLNSAFLLIWFSASLRAVLVNQGGATETLSGLALGGGLASAIVIDVARGEKGSAATRC